MKPRITCASGLAMRAGSGGAAYSSWLHVRIGPYNFLHVKRHLLMSESSSARSARAVVSSFLDELTLVTGGDVAG